MAQWILQPFTSKLLDIGLALASIIILGSFFLFLVKSFRKSAFDGDKIESLEVSKDGFKVNKESEGGDASPLQLVQNITVEQDHAAPQEEVSEPTHLEMPPFSQHRFFRLMDKAIDGRVIKLKSNHPVTEYSDVKNKAFAYFLFKCRTAALRDTIAGYISDCEKASYSIDVVGSILTRLDQATKLAEDKAKRAQICIDENHSLLGIPELMIDTFNEWNIPRINQIEDEVEDVRTSQFYPTGRDKALAILNTLTTVSQLTFDVAEYSLMGLNGELDKALSKRIVSNKECN